MAITEPTERGGGIVSAHVPASLADALDARAAEEERPLSSVIRRVLRAGLDDEIRLDIKRELAVAAAWVREFAKSLPESEKPDIAKDWGDVARPCREHAF